MRHWFLAAAPTIEYSTYHAKNILKEQKPVVIISFGFMRYKIWQILFADYTGQGIS
jgi:hypothetical protein